MTQIYVGKEGVFEANSENGAGEGVKVNHSKIHVVRNILKVVKKNPLKTSLYVLILLYLIRLRFRNEI